MNIEKLIEDFVNLKIDLIDYLNMNYLKIYNMILTLIYYI